VLGTTLWSARRQNDKQVGDELLVCGFKGYHMKLKPLLGLGIFTLFAFLSIARFVPAFRSWAAHHPMPYWFAAVLLVEMVLLANFMTVYQLWTGRASAWNWGSPETGYQGWVIRSRQPFGYWFRIALWGVITCVLDGALVFAVIQHVR